MKQQSILKSVLCLIMALVCNVAWADIDADGAVVTFTNVQQDGKEYALYINDENKLMTSAQSATALGDAAKFRATRLESGKWTFYNEAKNLYMIWRGNDSGYNNNTGVLGEYNATYCDWTLCSGDGNKMGTHYMVSKRSNGTTDGSVVIQNNGSFDKYGNSAGWASNYSNLYRIDIVELAPNTMEFFYNIGDGAYAGGGWCKNWTSNNASKPSLAVAVDVNNVNGGQAEAIGVRPGQAGSATFNVNAGCGMLSLSFEAKGTANHKIEINGVEQAVGTEWKKFVINGVNASTASFILKGDNGNDCLLRNIRIVTTVLYVKAEVEGSWADNPNTHFGRVRATMDNCVSVVNLTTAHLEESTYMFYSGGNDVVDFTRDYRGFEFQGYSFGGVDLGKSFTLTDEQKASITAETPLVAKFRATEAATLFYDDDEFSYRIPAIGKTSTGRLIAVSDYRHCLDDIGMNRWGKGYRVDLVMRTSDDNGKTWSPIKTIAEGIDNSQANDCAYGDAAIAVVGEEIVVMAVAGSTQYGQGNANKISRLVRVYSSDNGETWTKTDITEKVYGHEGSLYPAAYTAFFGSGKLAVDPDYNETGNVRIYGSLLAQGHGNRVIYSDDKGLTWSSLGGQVANANEPKVEILPNGQLLFSARRVGGRNFNVFTYTNKTSNEGSWASATNGCDNGGSNGTNGDIILVNAKKSDGSIVKLLLQSQPAGGTSEWDRRDVSIWYKEISSATDYNHTPSTIASGWSKGLQVSNQLSAYSAMSLQEDGKIAFFFEEAPCYRDNKDWGYCMVYMPLTIEEITKNNYSTLSTDLTTEVTINVVLTDLLGNVYRDQLQCGLANVAATLTAKYPFITLGNKANLSEVDGVYTYTNTVTLPFKVSNEETTVWHNIYFHTNGNSEYMYFYAGEANASLVGKKNGGANTAYGNSQWNTAEHADNMSWAVYHAGNFTFNFKNKLTGKFIQVTSVANGSAENVRFVEEDATAFEIVKDVNNSWKGDYSLKASVGNAVGYLGNTSSSYAYATHYNGNGHHGGWVTFVEAPDFEALFASINSAIESVNENYDIGTGLGQYQLNGITLEEISAAIDENNSNRGNLKVSELNNYKAKIDAPVLNMPENGQYFRVAYDYGGNVGKLYMQGEASSVKGVQFTDEVGDASIWQYRDGTLYSCSANKNLREHDDDRGLSDTKTTVEFSASSRAKGKYNIKCGSFIHANSSNDSYFTDHCSGDGGHAAHDFILEEVESFKLSISAVKYATLYLDYPVAIPAGVKVYIATSIEDDRLKMTQVAGVLPANTGVIVRAEEGAYDFVVSNDPPANVDGNLFKGTTVYTYIEAQKNTKYYVLAQKDGVVGMYRAELNGGKFVNNANKAYLPRYVGDLGMYDDYTNTDEEGGQLSNGLRFDFGGTSSIDNSQITIDNFENAIYDLLGRRVDNPTKGVYIVNGRKVVFR